MCSMSVGRCHSAQRTWLLQVNTAQHLITILTLTLLPGHGEARLTLVDTYYHWLPCVAAAEMLMKNCLSRGLLCLHPHRVEALSDAARLRLIDVCLSDVCLSRTSGLSQGQRGLGRLKLAHR